MLKKGRNVVISSYNFIKLCDDGDVEIWEGCHYEGGMVTSRYEHRSDEDFIADLPRAFESMSFYISAVKTKEQQNRWISIIKKYLNEHTRYTDDYLN